MLASSHLASKCFAASSRRVELHFVWSIAASAIQPSPSAWRCRRQRIKHMSGIGNQRHLPRTYSTRTLPMLG